MSAPDSVITIEDTAPPQTALTDTGTAFIVGLADRGSVAGQLTEDDALHSLGEFIAAHGARQSYNGPEYDTVEAFFADGGTSLYFSRYVGPDPDLAQISVPASSSQFTAVAKSPGAWANTVDVAVATGVVTIREGGTVKETSPTLANVGALQTWAAENSDYITVTPLVATSTALTDSAARTLAGGTDDRASATDTERQTAINRFGDDLGPGGVAMPGDTRTAAHTILATHARDHNRFAEGDAPDSSAAGTVAAAGTAVRALGRDLARHIRLSEPWLTAPGLTAGSTRTIPPCGVMLGMSARSDAVNANPNRAVAGANGISRFALGVKYARSKTERDTLADAGVTEIRSIRGVVQAYDDVTPVDPVADPEWLGAAANRFVMRVIADAKAIADAHMFGSISGPVDLGAFQGDLTAMLLEWFGRRSLYSEDGTPAGAFRVEAGPAVNTSASLAQRKLKAAFALKIAPNARHVEVQITNTPLNAAL